MVASSVTRCPWRNSALDFQFAQHGVDLGAASVYDDRVYAHQLEQGDIEGKGLFEGFVRHCVSAVLDDDDLILITPQIGQALDENPGLNLRLFPDFVPLGDGFLRFGRHVRLLTKDVA